MLFLAQMQMISTPIVEVVTFVYYNLCDVLPVSFFLIIEINIKARVISFLGSIKLLGHYNIKPCVEVHIFF